MASSMKKGWASLTTEQRDSLLELYDSGEDIEVLAKLTKDQYGVRIKAGTLARRLREWRSMKSGSDIKPEMKVSGDVNNKLITVVSERVKSLDDLIKVMEIDLDIWEVTHFEGRTYEGFRKKLDKNLRYRRGKADGHTKDEGGVTVVPLYRVQAWFVRKEPVKVTPVVEPISFKGITLPSKLKKEKKELRRAVILPDPQFGFRRKEMLSTDLEPFHDRRALDVALLVTEEAKPDEVIWLGDFLDMTDWSDKYIREVEFANLTQVSLLESGWWLAQFRLAAPQAEGIVFEGNHERRLVTSILRNMRAAWNIKQITFGKKKKSVVELAPDPVLSIPYLLSFDDLGYRFIEGYPGGTHWLNKALRVEHGQIARGAHTGTVKAVVQNRSESVIFGHIHRIEMATKTLHERDQIRSVTAFSPGCLCRLDGVVPGYSDKMQWQHGMAIVDYDPDGTFFNIQPVFINDGTAIYNGEYFVARDRLADLREDTGWDF